VNPSGAGEGSVQQSCFRYAVENPRLGGIGIIFAPQRRLEPLLDQLAPGPFDIAMLVSSAAAIGLSLQPSPNSDVSRMRAFVSSWAERWPAGTATRFMRTSVQSTAWWPGGPRKAGRSTGLDGPCAYEGWRSLIGKTPSPPSFDAPPTRPRLTNGPGANGAGSCGTRRRTRRIRRRWISS
jgi:hypothetical protein